MAESTLKQARIRDNGSTRNTCAVRCSQSMLNERVFQRYEHKSFALPLRKSTPPHRMHTVGAAQRGWGLWTDVYEPIVAKHRNSVYVRERNSKTQQTADTPRSVSVELPTWTRARAQLPLSIRHIPHIGTRDAFCVQSVAFSLRFCISFAPVPRFAARVHHIQSNIFYAGIQYTNIGTVHQPNNTQANTVKTPKQQKTKVCQGI